MKSLFNLDFWREVWQSRHLTIWLKAAAFSASLLLFRLNSSLGIFLFCLVALLLYSRPTHQFFRHFRLFGVLTITALLAVAKFREFAIVRPTMPGFFWIYILSAVFFGFLFYLLLGIKNLTFLRRKEAYYFLSACVLLFVFMMVLSSDRSPDFLFKIFVAVCGAYLVFRESFDFFASENKGLNLLFSKSAAALVFSLLLFQTLWAVSLLPIGFMNASALVLLFTLVLQDLIVNHWQGALTRRLTLRDASLFMLGLAIIFAASQWVL